MYFTVDWMLLLHPEFAFSWNTQWWLTLNSAVTGSPLEHLPACQLHCLLGYYYQDCKGDEISVNYSMNSASNEEHPW